MKTTRALIVGCGGIAQIHAQALADVEDVELIAGVEPRAEARAQFEAQWSVPTYTDLAGALAATQPDCAVVCTPPATHRATVERLVTENLHVLCEKPIALTEADARAMGDLADARGVVLGGSTKFRYVPTLDEAARRISDGAIGTPVFVEVTLCAPVAVEGRWMADAATSGGGVVMDNGSHAFDILAHVLRSPIEELTAVFRRGHVAPDVEDTAEILFTTADRLMGRIALSWTYFTKDLDYLMVQGTEGGLRVGWTGGLARRHGERDWTPFGEPYDKRLAFSRQLAAFVARIRQPTAAGAAWDPAATVGLLQSVYEAERTGNRRVVPPASLAG